MWWWWVRGLWVRLALIFWVKKGCGGGWGRGGLLGGGRLRGGGGGGLFGGGATAAGMGHLVAMDDSPAQLALTKLSVAMWGELREELPAAAAFRKPWSLLMPGD